MRAGKRRATAYIQLADHSPRGDAFWANDATVVNVTNAPPRQVAPGCIVVKVALYVPREAWAPAMPAVEVDVPADMVAPVTAEAVDPS